MDEPWRIYASAMQTQADAGGTVGQRGHLRVADVLVQAAEVTIAALVDRGWPWLAARALALRFLDQSAGWVVSDEGTEQLERGSSPSGSASGPARTRSTSGRG